MHSNTKQVAKQARGGKKRRTANNNDDDDGDDVEKNDRTTFFGERFWEVPLTLETNINLKNDPCLVPAEQITLRECDFDESSQIDETMEEVCSFFCYFYFVLQSFVYYHIRMKYALQCAKLLPFSSN